MPAPKIDVYSITYCIRDDCATENCGNCFAIFKQLMHRPTPPGKALMIADMSKHCGRFTRKDDNNDS